MPIESGDTLLLVGVMHSLIAAIYYLATAVAVLSAVGLIGYLVALRKSGQK